MEIAAVRGYALSSPIDPVQERPFHGGVRRLRKRDVVLVVVETRDGLRGIATAGASSSAMTEYFEGDSQGTFADVVEGPVADALEGETIDEIAAAHDLLRGSDVPDGDLIEAISAIDVALYDIAGKRRGAPVYELLADEYDSTPTTELDLYASAGMYMEPDGYVEQAQVLEELGFFGYKYRPGIGPEGDRETVERLAEGVDDIEIMLDVHTWWKLREGYDRETVRDLVVHADEHDAYWIEEPVEPDDHEGYVDLAATGAPLAGGESEESAAGLVALGETGAVDFLQGDVRHHEGFTGCREAVELCAGRDDLEFVPHNFGTWIGLAANAHLVAAAPEATLVEYPVFEDDPLFDTEVDPGMYPFDLAFDLIEGQPDITGGVLSVSDEPGLGVELNEDVIEQYPFRDGPWTEFHYDDA
ncbi:mandelate racemase/muconate lactonizing enzyme family protein [Halopiger xanaduensis]|uniref:Mandelate racemase/muconate lactonizing protein n=1 Tax=Halopiger xanaduensis (strain DSM 18323 / JCM 14033 / SH-6) TaxID=797210 RepID=F8DDB4_HALXS|nr:mandelate racemase/muconate lactonizing enzyme family protein [Halopiger xanaduensis]AEH39003.1 Mandelate racemase/muconate lactonizing protein [Halopiger xanaduensis SH-6]